MERGKIVYSVCVCVRACVLSCYTEKVKLSLCLIKYPAVESMEVQLHSFLTSALEAGELSPSSLTL